MKTSHFSSQPTLYLVLIALAISLVPGIVTVSANGRAKVVSSQEQGPYRIVVSIIPGSAIIGNTHLSIVVQDLDKEEFLTQARVMVSATGPASATDLGPLPALNDNSPQFYETNLPFDLQGQWQVTLDVSSHLGDASILIPMAVGSGGASTNWILVAAGAVALLTLGVWSWDRISGRKNRPGGGN